MSGKHPKGDYPYSVRLTKRERDWLEQHCGQTGMARSRVLATAFRLYQEQQMQSASDDDANAPDDVNAPVEDVNADPANAEDANA